MADLNVTTQPNTFTASFFSLNQSSIKYETLIKSIYIYIYIYICVCVCVCVCVYIYIYIYIYLYTDICISAIISYLWTDFFCSLTLVGYQEVKLN